MDNLLYAQNDGTLLVQSEHPLYHRARSMLLSFAELRQRIDPLHVYQIRPVTLWQAAALAITAREILEFLRTHAAHPIPFELQRTIVEETGKWGRLSLHRAARNRIALRGDRQLLHHVRSSEQVTAMALHADGDGIVFPARMRAEVKCVLAGLGYPVFDKVGYQMAPSVPFAFRDGVHLRDYQLEAVEQFFTDTREQSGVVVLPCGAGKTIVGLGVLARLRLHALILCPNESSARQWLREFLDKTTLGSNQVGLYDAGTPLYPITITTYQRVTAKTRAGERRHLAALTGYPWGIVVYDEVHMLPAPLFRLAADLQGARRLGLTATLVREDGADADVFSLIGPKCYEVPWKQLEQRGFLSPVRCIEVRVDFDTATRAGYLAAGRRMKHRIAALNEAKLSVAMRLMARHQGESILVLGHYLDSLRDIANMTGCPLITGDTPQAERELAFERFRRGEERCIVLSRVANMAVDLPCASVAIQLSGLFGSRQEEAQRLGRLLRPGSSEGVFYTLVSRDTVEERMAQHRQLYLAEQGYAYDIVTTDSLFPASAVSEHLAERG